jgi:phenylpropionate dioxygenase-like ring-hydroxylating dioxygenase large terminal subunit
MFLRNCWYVAAFAADVAAQLVARTVCGRAVVLFRTGGKVVALEDRCIHRGMPLSQGGEVDGDIIRCPYHGLEFNGAGTCRKIPGQDHVPSGARIAAFPLVERNALLWIWMGDPARADPAAIPEHHYHNDPGWEWRPVVLEIACDWSLLNDNLLDLTHLGFVHKKTIGGDPAAHAGAEMKVEHRDGRVHVTRWLANTEPPPFYRLGRAFEGNIDRWQEIEFRPGLVRIWTGGTDAGTGAYRGKREGGVQFMGFHGITPRTEHSCYYHFTQARNFRLGETELDERIHQAAFATLLEDKAVLEGQQARILENPGRGFIDIRADAGGLQGRRLVEQRLADEARTGVGGA